jgi:chromosome segregation ATPase
VESLLTFAEELERRDADVAEELVRIERLQAQVEELRTDGAAVASFLAALPAALAEREADERAAAEDHVRAEASVEEAEAALARARKQNDRLEAERTLQDARDAVGAADAWVEQARVARECLLRDAEQHRGEAEQLADRAAELADRVRDVPPPENGLDAALAWASRARGALLLEHSALVSERDTVVREASELLGSVLGEPLTTTAVAGVRDRLARALGDS